MHTKFVVFHRFIWSGIIRVSTFIFTGVISADELPTGFEDTQSTFIERLGAGTDKLLQEFFCWWGTGK